MTQATKEKNGVKVTVSYEKAVVYADNYNKIGASTHNFVKMTIEFNGQKITNNDLGFFSIIDRSVGRNDELDKRAYARFGDHFISEATYKLVKSALDEAKADAKESDEYKATKKSEEIRQDRENKEDAKYAKITKNREKHVGWCDKCQSYCYGDCQA